MFSNRLNLSVEIERLIDYSPLVGVNCRQSIRAGASHPNDINVKLARNGKKEIFGN